MAAGFGAEWVRREPLFPQDRQGRTAYARDYKTRVLYLNPEIYNEDEIEMYKMDTRCFPSVIILDTKRVDPKNPKAFFYNLNDVLPLTEDVKLELTKKLSLGGAGADGS